MREGCYDCVRKHIADAAIFDIEVTQGYPDYDMYVVGSLSQAAQEAVKHNARLADVLREHRLAYMADPTYDVPFIPLWRYVKTCIATGPVVPEVPEDCLPPGTK